MYIAIHTQHHQTLRLIVCAKMNTRQLSQGLVPAPEYERHHTFHSLRQFPELRRPVKDMQFIKLRSTEGSNPQSHSKGISRTVTNRSTHRLNELAQSSVEDMTAMNEFRKVLLENRKKLKQSDISEPKKDPKKDPAVSSKLGVIRKVGFSSDDEPVGSYGFIDPAEAADEKLTKISVSFDAQSYNSHLAGFSGSMLTKEEFRIQLRRCLNINLKQVELDALFAKMDVDYSGLIDGVEFVRYFFSLGTRARWAMQMETLSRRSKKIEDAKKKKLEDEKRIKEWEASQLSKFCADDFNTAMKKLETAAYKWDPTDRIDSLHALGFETYLTPYMFKQQIDKSFGVRLTNSEFGSLVKEFSTLPGEYCIDGHLFLKKFFSLRENVKREHKLKQTEFAKRKERVLKMGQHIDILSKELGR